MRQESTRKWEVDYLKRLRTLENVLATVSYYSFSDFVSFYLFQLFINIPIFQAFYNENRRKSALKSVEKNLRLDETEREWSGCSTVLLTNVLKHHSYFMNSDL
jgi:hypothetical protein